MGVMRLLVALSLLLLPALGQPVWGEEATPPPGPPEILPEGEMGDRWRLEEDYDSQEDELARLEEELAGLTELEITAVVSRAPGMEGWEEETANFTEVPEESGDDLLVVREPGPVGPLLELAWWHLLLLVLACLLVTCLCGYLTGCCFLTVDCCADPYWGCCSCCRPCVQPLKPPPNVSHSLRRKDTHLSTTYSLNESSTAPRRSVERSARSLVVSDRSVHNSTLLSDPPEPTMASLLAVAEDCSGTLPSSTLQSSKSVRNYKRAAPEVGLPGPGRCESQPHVYGEGTGSSYFSWLHLLGRRSSKRYTVTTPRNKRKPTNNNTVYRQNTRYRHIPDNSRNSAVIPTKISKRMSTASNFNGRLHLSPRSRSAETVDSLEDGPRPLLETSRSERQIPRSRLSANLATLEAGRSERTLGGAQPRTRRLSGRSTPVHCPLAPLLPEYNLSSFEKSLLKSRETTL